MNTYRVASRASRRLDEIFAYSERTWGEGQGDRYIDGLFEYFALIAARRIRWRAIPAEFGTDGYFGRYKEHFVYWRELDNNDVGIVTILHQRMHQIARLGEDWRADG